MTLIESIGIQLNLLATSYADYLVGAQYIRKKALAGNNNSLEPADADLAVKYSSLVVREIVKTHHIFLLATQKNKTIEASTKEMASIYARITAQSVLPELEDCEQFVQLAHEAYGKLIPETELLRPSQYS
jgi:hypothetical protein